MTSIRWFMAEHRVGLHSVFGWYTSFGGPLTEQEIDAI